MATGIPAARHQNHPRINPGFFVIMSRRKLATKPDPSPQVFYDTFRKVASSAQSALASAWPSSRNLTEVMRRLITPAVANELGTYYYIEYYGLDAILYHERDEINFRNPKWPYAKYISVALEFENDCNDAQVEMNKLQLVNAPLTVLITYPYPETKEKGRQLLQRYSGIVQEADVFRNASTQRRQLAILGYPGPEWEAFVYQDGKFVPLMSAFEASTAI